MPPRRRTFYLGDATILSNPKVRRLARQHPDRWLSVLGAFHVLIGVATLNGSPRLTRDEITDTIGEGHDDLIGLLREVGLMTTTGIRRETFDAWTPKARPKYPSDEKGRPNTAESDGETRNSAGVGRSITEFRRNSDGVHADSGGVPTSSTSSSSSTGSTSPSDGVVGARLTALSGASAADPLALRDAEDARLRTRLPEPKANRLT